MSSSNRSYLREQQLLRIHKDRGSIEAAAIECGLALTVRNQLQHWTFARKGLLIEWWPGSGKVAIGKDFDASLRADDAKSMIALLERHKAPSEPERRSAIPAAKAVAAALDAFDFEAAAALLRRRPETLRKIALIILEGCRLAPGSTVLCGGMAATRGQDGGLSLSLVVKQTKELQA